MTFNSAAVLLSPTEENLPAIRALLGPDSVEPREVVALHYRARPHSDPDFRHTRSYVGVSVHEPDLMPIRRLESPVLGPDDPFDALGAEDPRVTRLDGAWWTVYCGVSPLRGRAWLGSVCTARSEPNPSPPLASATDNSSSESETIRMARALIGFIALGRSRSSSRVATIDGSRGF